MLVFDKANNDVTNRFTLNQSGIAMYLTTNDYFYFEGPDKDILNEFKFEFTVTTPGPVVNKLEPKGTSSNPIRVTNVNPIINIPSDQVDTARSYTSAGILSLLDNFNGSADPKRKTILKSWTISPVTAPSSQDFKTEFFLNIPNSDNSIVYVNQRRKNDSEGLGQANFGTYTYVLTAEDEGGATTSVTITQDIGIPNMVDYMSLVQRQNFIQADGAVEFFVEELSNLDSTNVIPQDMQIGYTTSGLTYDNEIKGPVCESGDTNDSVYYARAYKSKPQANPSSIFYVYTRLKQFNRAANKTSAGVYAAIEFRENSSGSWVVAKDVFGNDCIYANETINEVKSTGDVILSGMTSEDTGNDKLAYRLSVENRTELASSTNTKSDTQGFAEMVEFPAGRVFVLNQPGEYRIAWGNLYNNYNALTRSGGEWQVDCSDVPSEETNIKYEIGDFTNVSLSSFIRDSARFKMSNVYKYETEAWKPLNAERGAYCEISVFEPAVTYYSASPFARYLYATNTTQVDARDNGGNTTYSEPDQIFGLFTDTLLTSPITIIRPSNYDGDYYARIRQVGTNPESTRDGTYLIRTFKNRIEVVGPCLDKPGITSSNSGSGGPSI